MATSKKDTVLPAKRFSIINSFISTLSLYHVFIKHSSVRIFTERYYSVNDYKVKLDLLNPDNILDKGYSIIYKDNKIIKDINSIGINDPINIVVKNGNIDAVVKGVNNGKERK